MQVNYSYSLCNSRSFKTLNSIQSVKLEIIHHLVALEPHELEMSEKLQGATGHTITTG